MSTFLPWWWTTIFSWYSWSPGVLVTLILCQKLDKTSPLPLATFYILCSHRVMEKLRHERKSKKSFSLKQEFFQCCTCMYQSVILWSRSPSSMCHCLWYSLFGWVFHVHWTSILLFSQQVFGTLCWWTVANKSRSYWICLWWFPMASPCWQCFLFKATL